MQQFPDHAYNRVTGGGMKRFLKIALLIVAASVGLSAQREISKATCSLSIRPAQINVKAGSPIEIEVNKTNTSNYVLNNSRATNPGENYTFEVRRDGTPAAESETLRHLMKPGSTGPEEKGTGPIQGRYKTNYIFEDLPPHETFKEMVLVSEYYDMTKPGKYSIQLSQGRAKSNTITVIVTP